MTSIVLQPNRHGRVGLSVSLADLCAAGPDLAEALVGSPDRMFTVYAKDGSAARDFAGWSRLAAGDPVLFYHNRRYFARGRVASKLVSSSLARALWPEELGARDHVILIDQLVEVDLPAPRFHRAIGYAPHHVIQGFTVLDEERSRRGLSMVRRLRPSQMRVEPMAAGELDFDDREVVEGRLRLVRHLERERDRRVVRLKKSETLRQTGRLACEACGHDFREAYPWLELDWCEVHHDRPLAEAPVDGRRVRTNELSVLCSNCHRMIPKCRPMPSVRQFRRRLHAGP